MNQKDDAEFLAAFQSAGKRDALLKRLILIRRFQVIVIFALMLVIMVICMMQLIGKNAPELNAGVVVACMANLFMAVQSDMKIKILMTQKTAEQ